jgi:hypothetical protein
MAQDAHRSPRWSIDLRGFTSLAWLTLPSGTPGNPKSNCTNHGVIALELDARPTQTVANF